MQEREKEEKTEIWKRGGRQGEQVEGEAVCVCVHVSGCVFVMTVWEIRQNGGGGVEDKLHLV